MPADEYLAIEATSISRLKELRRSPLHYRHALEHPKETVPLRLGTAAHCATLEPERFGRQFAIWSRRSDKTGNLCPRTGQWWEAFEAQNRSEEHTSELQSPCNLVCRLLLEKKKGLMQQHQHSA